jgi:hypothetical protein
LVPEKKYLRKLNADFHPLTSIVDYIRADVEKCGQLRGDIGAIG